MDAALNAQKDALRKQVRSGLLNTSPAICTISSAELCARLREQKVWSAARSVLFFAPLPDEPDIWPLLSEAIAAGKTIALPAFVPGTNRYTARQIIDPARDIIAGQFGIQEPVATGAEIPLNRLDLVLVPGIAFDAHGGRLGRGKGFYDRLLADVRGTKCGVAFEEQMVDVVPVGPLDIRLHCILTPTRWIET
jgi:5-formyltetrahydrofolate cyclo-ligase